MSKAIQRFLAGKANCISSARVCFPAQGREGVLYEPLYRALCEDKGRALDAALSANDPQDGDNGVLSCEAFHDPPPRSVRIIFERLGAAQIVLFIRGQALVDRLHRDFRTK